MSIIVDIDFNSNPSTPYGFTSVTDATSGFSVTSGSALAGTAYGMNCNVNDTTGFYGTYLLGAGDTSGVVRCRFYLKRNAFSMANLDDIYFLRLFNSGANAIANVRFRYETVEGIRFTATAVNDAGSEIGDINSSALNDNEHYVEVNLTKSSGADDGTLQLWVDGVSQGSVSNIDNDTRFADFRSLRFGPSAGLSATTAGDIFIDELIVNNDGSEIGPEVLPALSVSVTNSSTYYNYGVKIKG